MIGLVGRGPVWQVEREREREMRLREITKV